MWCTFADQADYLIVVARTTPYDPQHRHAGIRRFYVPKERGSVPARIDGHADPQDRLLRLADVGAVDRRSAPPGRPPRSRGRRRRDDTEGFARCRARSTEARAHTAARAIGLARGALEDSVAYCQQREQFDRPIGDFQALRFKIAHMAAEIEAAGR